MIFGLAIVAFLVGSIPFGLLIAKSKGINILEVGSGNIGATNVHRALGAKAGTLVFALDILKGFLPGYMVFLLKLPDAYGLVPQTQAFIIGAVSMMGHMFSPWLKFKGGKGVATGFGALLASTPFTGLVLFAIVALTVLITRYVSLGSILAALAAIPVSQLVFRDTPQLIPFLAALTVFVVYKHKANIKRLMDGTESKFGGKKPDPKPVEDRR
ncbi:MAG TPA: glycerol-3-phosphate 1-O-acyltransferase PlsY [Fimbriimonas sp.]|nr:glycerol-3-phosphate 1-O-acyltransferase PlsY [Fimbriimonas sp.]